MTKGVPPKLIGATMGLAAFAIAIIAGLAAGNEADSILLRAIFSLVACNLAGWLLGLVAERCVVEALDRIKMRDAAAPGSDSVQGIPKAMEQAA